MATAMGDGDGDGDCNGDGDGDGNGDGGGTRCDDNDILTRRRLIRRLRLCGAGTTTAAAGRQGGSGRWQGGDGGSYGARCNNDDIDDDNHPSHVIVDAVVIQRLRLCGTGTTAAAGWQWGSGRQRGGRAAVEGDERDGAARCDDDDIDDNNDDIDNHPLPIVVNAVVTQRLRLCGAGTTMTVAGWQLGSRR
jgi:hypothetical protein